MFNNFKKITKKEKFIETKDKINLYENLACIGN